MSRITNNLALPLKAHKQWLRRELAYANLDDAYLLGLTMLLERVICREQQLLQRRQIQMPFYSLHDNDGCETQAWVHIAETALWLAYKRYKPILWFTAICQYPAIKTQLITAKCQIPINWFAPTSRLSTNYIRRLEQFYLRWLQAKRAT